MLVAIILESKATKRIRDTLKIVSANEYSLNFKNSLNSTMRKVI